MQMIAFLYPISSTILAAFYLPQILTVAKAKSALKEVSLLTWGVWSICLTISFLYSGLIVQDMKIATFSFINCICCFIIFLITFYKRFFKYKNHSIH